MTAMTRELAFAIGDLRRVFVECSTCGTSVCLDLGNFRTGVGDRMIFAPRSCPSCKRNFDTALESLNALQEAYSHLVKLGDRIQFRVVLSEKEKAKD